MSSAISLPFRFNEFGQVDTTASPDRFWKDQILLTIFTRFGERVLRPSFGSNVVSALFENSDLASEVAVSSIKLAFNTWLPQLSLVELTPLFNEKTDSLEVKVVYLLPSGESDTITLNTAIFNRSGDIIQEIPRG